MEGQGFVVADFGFGVAQGFTEEGGGDVGGLVAVGVGDGGEGVDAGEADDFYV